MLDTISQVFILACGFGALILATSPIALRRKWASPIGLLSEPFWFYSAFVNDQWGILILSMAYGTRWAQCFYRDWFSAKKIIA